MEQETLLLQPHNNEPQCDAQEDVCPGLGVHHILQPFCGSGKSVPEAVKKSLYEVWLLLNHRLNQSLSDAQSMVTARYNTITTINKNISPIMLLPSCKSDEPVLDIYPAPSSKDPRSSTPS